MFKKEKSKEFFARDLRLPLGAKTLIMGILNVTPDSFSDGGKWTEEEIAIQHAQEMMKDGADLIDVGGESTRPGSRPVSAEEEIERIKTVVKSLVEAKIPVSVDTWKSQVARAVLELGAPIINDIYALMGDPAMAEVVAEYKAGLILMNHPAWYWPDRPESKVFPFRESLATVPDDLKTEMAELDCVDACLKFLDLAINKALKAGVPEENIMLDPGIGFGLTPQENLRLINQLDRLKEFSFPVLLAPSRKRFIRRVLGDNAEAAELGTSVTLIWGVQQEVDMVRVHDVKTQAPYLRMADALRLEELP